MSIYVVETSLQDEAQPSREGHAEYTLSSTSSRQNRTTVGTSTWELVPRAARLLLQSGYNLIVHRAMTDVMTWILGSQGLLWWLLVQPRLRLMSQPRYLRCVASQGRYHNHVAQVTQSKLACNLIPADQSLQSHGGGYHASRQILDVPYIV